MTFLIILAGYVVGMLITARVIGNMLHAADIAERDRKNQERDDAMRPWNLVLRDPDASETMKAFAAEVLRDLALK